MSRLTFTVLLVYLGASALLAGCQTAGGRGGAGDEVAAALGGSGIAVVAHRPEGVDAADDPAGDALTLPEAVRRAVAHDPAVQVALAKVRSAVADARQTRLLPNPVLSLAFRFPEGGGDPIVEAGLAADLLSLLQRPRRMSAADNRLRGASAGVLTAALDTVAEVQQAYTSAQAVEAELAVLRERRQLAERLLAGARARAAPGGRGRQRRRDRPPEPTRHPRRGHRRPGSRAD